MSDKKDLFVPDKVKEEVENTKGAYRPKESVDDLFDRTYKSELKWHKNKKKTMLKELGSCYSDFCDYFNFMDREFGKVTSLLYDVSKDLDNWALEYRSEDAAMHLSLKKPGYTMTGQPDFNEFYFFTDFQNRTTNGDVRDYIRYSCKFGISEEYFKIHREETWSIQPKLDQDQLDFTFKDSDITEIEKYLNHAKAGISSMEASIFDVAVNANFLSKTKPSRYFKSKDLKKGDLEKLSKLLLVKMFNEEDFELDDVISEALK